MVHKNSQRDANKLAGSQIDWHGLNLYCGTLEKGVNYSNKKYLRDIQIEDYHGTNNAQQVDASTGVLNYEYDLNSTR